MTPVIRLLQQLTDRATAGFTDKPREASSLQHLERDRDRDFNQDGNTDILWRNADGLVAEWLMGNGTRQATMVIQNMTGWSAVATGDFNGDGTDDVMWRNDSGVTTAWFMRHRQINHTNTYASTAGWNEVAAGDFNHDGAADIMWQNATNGEVDTWLFSYSGMVI